MKHNLSIRLAILDCRRILETLIITSFRRRISICESQHRKQCSLAQSSSRLEMAFSHILPMYGASESCCGNCTRMEKYVTFNFVSKYSCLKGERSLIPSFFYAPYSEISCEESGENFHELLKDGYRMQYPPSCPENVRRIIS